MKKTSSDHRYHLSKDKILKKVIRTQDSLVLEKRNKVYLRLCSSILSQQLSTKVAAVLYERFLALYDGAEPSVQQILLTDTATFRSIGFSNAKAGYVHNVCRFFIEKNLSDEQLHTMNNEEVITLLTQIKGVGKWTVEMILMFTLGREDVFALDDLGLQQAVAKLYQVDSSDKKAFRTRLQEISFQWSPYRTYASRYLWNWKDR